MKIGVDASCWVNRRGYGRYTRELLRALLALDGEDEYRFFLDRETADRSDDLPERARRVVVDTDRAAARAASSAGRRSLRDLWAMRRAVREHGRDLDLFYFPSVYTFFPVRTRAKIVVTIHDTIAERYPELIFPSRRARLFWTLKVRLAIRQAARIATVSETARREILREFGLPEGRVAVIPDAVSESFRPADDPRETRRALGRFGLGGGDRFLLYVGGISPHKNLTALLDAYASLAEEDGIRGAKLVLAGDFEGDVFTSAYPALAERVRASALSSKVIFTGFVSDAELRHLYNAAECLVLPSFAEGFGLPAAEAMACGTPVVASRAGALPEVTGGAARLFDPRAPDELRACLREVLRDERLRGEMRRKGLLRARDLSWERSARAALEAFRSLSGEHEPAAA